MREKDYTVASKSTYTPMDAEAKITIDICIKHLEDSDELIKIVTRHIETLLEDDLVFQDAFLHTKEEAYND